MWTAIIAFFKSLFAKKAATIWAILIKNTTSLVMKKLTDKDLQQKAYELVKQLHLNKELTGLQKAAIFNKSLIAYCVKNKTELKTYMVNTLREIALAALSVQLENGEITEEQIKLECAHYEPLDMVVDTED